MRSWYSREVEPSANICKQLGHLEDFFHEFAGHEPGDPTKAAQAIITVVNTEHPPLRLLLGRDAVQLARKLDQADLTEIDRWEQLSTSTDYEGMTDQTGIGRLFEALPNPT